MTVEASFQTQADHLAQVAKEWVISFPSRTSLWSLIDNTQDLQYETNVERSGSNLDHVLDSTETTIPSAAFEYWGGVHQAYFFQTSRSANAFSQALTGYHWRVSEHLANVINGVIGLDPTYVCADSGTNYGGFAYTGSDSTIAATDSALAMTSVGPIELLATSTGIATTTEWIFTVQGFFNDSSDSYVDSAEIVVSIPNSSPTGTEVVMGGSTLRAAVSADTTSIPISADIESMATVNQYARLSQGTTEEIVQINKIKAVGPYLEITDDLRYGYTNTAPISLLWSGIEIDSLLSDTGETNGYEVIFTNAQDREYDYTTTYP